MHYVVFLCREACPAVSTAALCPTCGLRRRSAGASSVRCTKPRTCWRDSWSHSRKSRCTPLLSAKLSTLLAQRGCFYHCKYCMYQQDWGAKLTYWHCGYSIDGFELLVGILVGRPNLYSLWYQHAKDLFEKQCHHYTVCPAESAVKGPTHHN